MLQFINIRAGTKKKLKVLQLHQEYNCDYHSREIQLLVKLNEGKGKNSGDLDEDRG